MDRDTFMERWTANEKFISQVFHSIVGVKDKQDQNHLKVNPAKKIHSIKAKSSDRKVKKSKNTPSPVIEDGTLIFSKFDLMKTKNGEKKQGKEKKVRKDVKLKATLSKLQKQENSVKKLIDSGESGEAMQLKTKKAWSSALEKAEGKKVYDDPKRIASTLKRRQKVKQKHGKEWAKRKKAVEVKIAKRQEKRERNISKKKLQKQKSKKNKKR